MVKIAIVGAGQLGSRHLQALALLEGEVSLQVVDPSPSSLGLAKQRFEEVHKTQHPIKIEYLNDLDKLNDSLDIVIVATRSDHRRAVIERLLSRKIVKYLILEKVLFQQAGDYGFIGELLKHKGVKAWVNCPRRMFSIYKLLKEKFCNAQRIDFSVTGSGLGIGCNGIHFLDLLSYFTGEVDFEIFSDQLDDAVIQTKRQEIIDFTGTLYGVSPNNSRFSMTQYLVDSVPMLLQINSSKIRCQIDEANGIAQISNKQNGWKWESVSFDVPYQSSLTQLVVEQLLAAGSCDLTNYEDSCKLHLSFIKPLLLKYSLNQGKICPIT